MSERLHCPMYWSRAIILVDMNAFFASIEQLDNPHLQGRPVAVTNGQQGSCIITCSYEARAYGIKTGMRLRDAYQLCPDLIRCPSRPKRYSELSKMIMRALADVCPDIEVFSVDEAFIDATQCQRLYGSPVRIAKLIQATVWRVSGLACSIGISGDKTTAKYAAKCQKPNGFTVIPPWESRQRLANIAVTELCGVGKGIGRFLAERGAYTCGDVTRLPVSVLGRRYGGFGRRIWLMCHGSDPDPIRCTIQPAKSMGHGKVMPPNTCEQEVILTYLQHMSEKLAARLRRHDLAAKHFFIGLRQQHAGWLGGVFSLPLASNSGSKLYHLCQQMLQQFWCGQPVRQVQVTALSPHTIKGQLELFDDPMSEARQLNEVIDSVNVKYGELSLQPARLLNRSTMPNVIAPAWQPDGWRKSV